MAATSAFSAMPATGRCAICPGSTGCRDWSRGAALARLLALAPRCVAAAAARSPGSARCSSAPDERPGRRYAADARLFYRWRQGGRLWRGDAGPAASDPRSICSSPISPRPNSLVAGANRADIHTYLPDDLMVKVDVASMAHGLEIPLAAARPCVAGMGGGLPEQVKMARGVTKALFKSAMAPYLPAELLHRPKMGFGCPDRPMVAQRAEGTRLRHAAVAERAERGLFRPDYVRRLLDEHCSFTRDHHTAAVGATDAGAVVPNVDRCSAEAAWCLASAQP